MSDRVMIDAFFLPGIEETHIAQWDVRQYGDLSLRFPVLDPVRLRSILDELRGRGAALKRRPVAAIVGAVDAAAARLADHDSSLRRLAERALPAITGYSPAMIRLGLDRMVSDWRRESLQALLRAELGDAGVLDGFQPKGIRLPDAAGSPPDSNIQAAAKSSHGSAREPDSALGRTRAVGPALAFHIFAGNVPGVAVTSLVRSLLVKAPTFAKTASGEPLLPVLFARALADVDAEIASALGVTYWPGGTADLEAAALEAADTVVLYGGAEVEADIMRRIAPAQRLVVHGPRFSFGMVAREALTHPHASEVAADAARSVAVFDQQGCVSPHLIYVEQGGEISPEQFAEHIARELDALESELPRGTISAAEASQIHQSRAAAEFRALARGVGRLYTSEGTAWTVEYDADAAFTTSCLNRVIAVKAIDRLEDVARHVRPHARYLQSVAIAASEERIESLANELAMIGASRITSFRDLAWPPPTWHHDGRGPLRELLRWVDWEFER